MECIGYETDPEYFSLACQCITEEIKRQGISLRLEFAYGLVASGV